MHLAKYFRKMSSWAWSLSDKLMICTTVKDLSSCCNWQLVELCFDAVEISELI